MVLDNSQLDFCFNIGSFFHITIFLFTLVTLLIEDVYSKWFWFGMFTSLYAFDVLWLIVYTRTKFLKSEKRQSRRYRIFFWGLFLMSSIFYFFIVIPITVTHDTGRRYNEWMSIFIIDHIPIFGLGYQLLRFQK